jgi:hypothetical protein
MWFNVLKTILDSVKWIQKYHSRLISDEMWIHHGYPEIKQSMQWKYNGSPVPKKF